MNIDRRAKRWALLLGTEDNESSYKYFSQEERKIDTLLKTLYAKEGHGSLAPSDPQLTQWVNDIGNAFPEPVFKLLQRDAISRFGLSRLVNNDDFLNTVVPDIYLVSTLLSLKNALPEKSYPMIIKLVNQLVQDIEKRIKPNTIDRIKGLPIPAKKTTNPRNKLLDWNKTIKKNLENYQPKLGTIIPEKFYVHPLKGKVIHQIILLIDQSASMSRSIIYAGVLGSILSKIRTLQTNLIVFDTAVIDMTEYLEDPVDLLMKVQLGGGTNIQKAVRYVNHIIHSYRKVHVVLISDLFEGPPVDLLLRAVQEVKNKTSTFSVFLALDDEGTPVYDIETGKILASLEIPVLSCTPDQFPDLMSKIINEQEINEPAGIHIK